MSFERWMSRLGAALAADAAPAAAPARDDLERVTALLLVEIARSDHEVDTAEHAAIRDALAAASSLEPAEIDALVDEALAEADATLSLHEHVRRVNASLDRDGRVALVEQMWRVALADGDIDRYEEYTIRKLADLLYIKHRDFMRAKLRVLEGRAGGAGTDRGAD